MSTLTGSVSRGVVLPKFDADEKKWRMFSMQMLAYATMNNWYDALTEGGESDFPSRHDEDVSDSSTTAKAKKAALHRNRLAMACLTMALGDESLIQYVDKASTSGHPNGEAHIVWKCLKDKYEPKDGVNRVAMIKQLFAIDFPEKQDPSKYFGEMSGIRARYQTAAKKLSEDLQIAAVVIGAPAIYDDVITAEQRSKGDAMTLENLEEAMRTLYRVKIEARKGTDDNDGDENTEMQLAAFSGTCFKCNEKGHMAHQCPKKRSFSGKCHNCDIRGHRMKDCRKPGGGASREVANPQIDGEVEVLL